MFVGVESERYLKTLARFGRGGTASAVGEGLLQMIKKLLELDICRNPFIRPAATFSLREKTKNVLTSFPQILPPCTVSFLCGLAPAAEGVRFASVEM